MVIMKLGDELLEPFLEVVEFLGKEHNLRVVVEPHVYEQQVAGRQQDFPYIYTYTQGDRERWVRGWSSWLCVSARVCWTVRACALDRGRGGWGNVLVHETRR